MTNPSFSGGVNIAMKIPKADFEATVAFYRDVLGFELNEEDVTTTPTVSRSYGVSFGPNNLWLDCVDGYSRSDLWLELTTDDLEKATDRLAAAGTTSCDEIEPIASSEIRSHWIKNPAGIVHLLKESKDN